MALITAANARQLAAQAAIARQEYRRQRAAELTQLRSEVQRLNAELSALQSGHPSRSSGDYASARLQRVREQLDRIDTALAKETDPLAIERLSRASSVLSAQEFGLSGRPAPGSLRPTAAAARRSVDLRNTLTAPASPAPNTTTQAPNPFRRAGQ